MSYYPHNQPILALGTDSDRTLQSQTGTLVPTATIAERSQAGSPCLEGSGNYHGQLPPIPVPSSEPTVS